MPIINTQRIGITGCTECEEPITPETIEFDINGVPLPVLASHGFNGQQQLTQSLNAQGGFNYGGGLAPVSVMLGNGDFDDCTSDGGVADLVISPGAINWGEMARELNTT